MQYRSEIDGTRALAVIPVVLFHAGVAALPGGFLGVDVFFVLSGYLITAILLADLDAGKFSLLNFYERRARRLLPAMLLVILVTYIAGLFLLLPFDFRRLSESVMWVAGFAANVLFWQQADYFDEAAGLKPLLHMWSLGVEEQFYIAFPIILAMLWKLRRNFLVPAIAIGGLGSFALAVVLARYYPAAAFYLIPARAWELAAGALCAVWLKGRTAPFAPATRSLLASAGLLCVIGSFVLVEESWPMPGWPALLPVAGTALIILFAGRDNAAGRVLAWGPLAGIGLVSYSFYLWHHPVLALVRLNTLETPPVAVMASIAMACIIPAWASWRWVERPFRNRAFLSRTSIFAFSAAGLAAVFALGYAGWTSHGFPGRPVQPQFAVQLLDYEIDNGKLRAASWRETQQAVGDASYRVYDNARDNELWFDLADERPKVLLVGNSHSKDMLAIMQRSAVSQRFQLARYGAEMTRFAEGLYSSPNYRAADAIIYVGAIKQAEQSLIVPSVEQFLADGKRVVLVAKRPHFSGFRGGTLTLADKIVLDQAEALGRDGAALKRTADSAYFADMAAGAGVPPFHADPRPIYARLAARHSDVILVYPADYMCSAAEKTCASMDARLNKFFFDGGHNTRAGNDYFAAQADRIGWFGPIEDLVLAGPAATSR